jgi:hypothetical protein
MWMGLGFPNCPFIAQFTLSSVKLHLLLREVDFCSALHNVPVFQISVYKILYALKSVCILLLRSFLIYITSSFASSWNQIGILLGKFIPLFVFPKVMMVLSV